MWINCSVFWQNNQGDTCPMIFQEHSCKWKEHDWLVWVFVCAVYYMHVQSKVKFKVVAKQLKSC